MVWNRGKLTMVFLLLVSTGWAQVNRYVVFFRDKAGTPFTVDEPTEFLSLQAIERRVEQGISISQEDLPVNENYVQGVRDAGAKTFFRTKWMNGVLVQCDASLIPTIQSLAYVDRVEFVAPNERLTAGRKRTELKTKELKTASSTQLQLHMIGLDEMHATGNKGEDIVIGIFDGGFQGVNTGAPFQHIFNVQLDVCCRASR
jgi:serine protease AprX